MAWQKYPYHPGGVPDKPFMYQTSSREARISVIFYKDESKSGYGGLKNIFTN